jgi:hypothetical protein
MSRTNKLLPPARIEEIKDNKAEIIANGYAWNDRPDGMQTARISHTVWFSFDPCEMAF